MNLPLASCRTKITFGKSCCNITRASAAGGGAAPVYVCDEALPMTTECSTLDLAAVTVAFYEKKGCKVTALITRRFSYSQYFV